MDVFFERLWVQPISGSKIHLTIDTTGCDNISVSKAFQMKRVLDKHREHSKKYLDRSTIIVRSMVVAGIIKTALVFLKTERPVHVLQLKDDRTLGYARRL
jgi:hypothetical protein